MNKISLTANGLNKVNTYIRELEAKRKEILDAGKDVADETDLPTVKDIEADIEFEGIDEDGEYINGWGVTDDYDADSPLGLKLGEDFIVAPLNETQLKEMINAGYTRELVGILENDDLTIYNNVEELGADNSDNGCREKDDTDEAFGQFLIQSFKDGNSNGTFYFELSDGQVVVGNFTNEKEYGQNYSDQERQEEDLELD